MNQDAIQKIVEEIGPQLTGRYLGKVVQLARFSFALDFGLKKGHYLFISAEPAAPRLYLIKRRFKELEKASIALSQFGQILRAKLSAAALLNIIKDPSERVIRFLFRAPKESGKTENTVLIVQLTGRSSNLFLIDEQEQIIASLRVAEGAGQSVGTPYEAPTPRANVPVSETPVTEAGFSSLSAALDAYYQSEELEKAFQQRANSLQSRLRQEIQRKKKLEENLKRDLAAHGDAQEHKRLGDLLLANLATADRTGSKVRIRDFYMEGAPTIELDLDENIPLQEHATRYFARYTKAKRATEEIAARLRQISQETTELLAKEAALVKVIDEHDEEGLGGFEKPTEDRKPDRKKTGQSAKIPGVRFYRSSDGYEILVGRGAAVNDHLTFRVARPNDLWLHSGDYPGSHVVVRRLNRNDIPHRTIIEAAQLAARFSQASKDSKVVVHYTQRKFLSKPKGAAPGLVRMSRFKTILVEPKESVERDFV